MRVLGIDPGNTTGWCIQEDNEKIDWGHVKFLDAPQFLSFEGIGGHDWTSIDVIVVEDFMLLGGKALAQIGSRFETVQVIGMVKLRACQLAIPVATQPPTIKTLASKYSGIKVPSNHSQSHRVDAQLHAIFYLKGRLKYKTILERELEKERQ